MWSATLKIRYNHYVELSEAINEVKANVETKYNSTWFGMYDRYHSQGLSDTRFMWDILRVSSFNPTRLYHYLNDNHIESALKRIIFPITH